MHTLLAKSSKQMKSKIIFIICLCFLISACKDEKKADIKSENSNEIVLENTNSEPIKDCEDFLNTYDTWTNELIELMAKHKDDPVTLATSPEYVNTMMKGVNFIQDWETISFSCATNANYSKRMKEIQNKLNEKQKELGLK